MDEKSRGKKSQEKSNRKKNHTYNVIFQIIKAVCKNYFNALIFKKFYTVIYIFFLNRDPVVYLVHVFNS